jgi:hypothetical protein
MQITIEISYYARLKQFTLDSEEVLHSIFATDRQTEVFMLVYQDLKLEIFIDPEGEKGRFTHLCLEYDNPDEVSDQAHQQGYRRWVKKGPNRVTHFIWDKSGRAVRHD